MLCIISVNNAQDYTSLITALLLKNTSVLLVFNWKNMKFMSKIMHGFYQNMLTLFTYKNNSG